MATIATRGAIGARRPRRCTIVALGPSHTTAARTTGTAVAKAAARTAGTAVATRRTSGSAEVGSRVVARATLTAIATGGNRGAVIAGIAACAASTSGTDRTTGATGARSSGITAVAAIAAVGVDGITTATIAAVTR